MELRQLYHFQTIAQYGNLTRAAEALMVSQPNLSRTLAALETEVGAPLFQREKGKALVLNENGRQLFELTQRIFSDIEQTVSCIQNRVKDEAPSIHISMTTDNTVNECIADFCTLHPEVMLYQTFCSNEQLCQLLAQGEPDIGITLIEPHDPVIAAMELARFEVAIGVSPEHPSAAKSEVRLKDLQNSRFLCNDMGINKELTEQICQRAGFFPQTLTLTNSRLIDNQLRQPGNVVLVPVESRGQEFPMHILKISDWPQTLTLWACFHRTKQPGGIVLELLERIKEFYQYTEDAVE